MRGSHLIPGGGGEGAARRKNWQLANENGGGGALTYLGWPQHKGQYLQLFMKIYNKVKIFKL